MSIVQMKRHTMPLREPRTRVTLLSSLIASMFVLGGCGGGGEESSLSTASESAAERFAAELESRCQVPVIRVDERLSSAEAEYRLRDQRRSGIRQRKVRSGDVDAVAACVIAETWLDQPASSNRVRTSDEP